MSFVHNKVLLEWSFLWIPWSFLKRGLVRHLFSDFFFHLAGFCFAIYFHTCHCSLYRQVLWQLVSFNVVMLSLSRVVAEEPEVLSVQWKVTGIAGTSVEIYKNFQMLFLSYKQLCCSRAVDIYLMFSFVMQVPKFLENAVKELAILCLLILHSSLLSYSFFILVLILENLMKPMPGAHTLGVSLFRYLNH